MGTQTQVRVQTVRPHILLFTSLFLEQADKHTRILEFYQFSKWTLWILYVGSRANLLHI